jgi:hypothetical protein
MKGTHRKSGGRPIKSNTAALWILLHSDLNVPEGIRRVSERLHHAEAHELPKTD